LEKAIVSRFFKAFFDGPEFVRNTSHRGVWEVIRWWESRRFFFNLVVGCTGILTLILMTICAVFAESVVGEAIGMSDGPLLEVFGIFFYGILANLFYTAGWIVEIGLRTTIAANRSAALGLKAFRAGVVFSIFITLFPALFCWLAFAIAFLHGQKHGSPGE
jgi:hypothetical protein